MTSNVIKKTPPVSSGELDIVQNYKSHLRTMGNGLSDLDARIQTLIHLVTWMSLKGVSTTLLDIRVVRQFLHHKCTCPGPHGYRKDIDRVRRHLHRFLAYLMETERVRMPAEIETGGRLVESFLQPFESQGYAAQSVINYRTCCRHFIVWLYLNGIGLAEVSDEIVTQFLSHHCDCVQPHFCAASSRFSGGSETKGKIRSFIEYLIDAGIAPPRPLPTPDKSGQHLPQFQIWLRQERGITEQTIRDYCNDIEAFIVHLDDDPAQYTATLIQKAVQHRLEAVSRDRVRRQSSALRMYLRFLALEGLCRPGLAGAIPTIPRQKFATLPRHLPQQDIEHIIASCDSTTAVGVRNRAILLLLSRLALRAGDVANLRLKDIDWDNALVHVSGKSQREAVLPLPQDVGDALKEYILHVRPVATTESVFLRMLPPLHQPLSGKGVSAIAAVAIKRCGLKTDGLPAAHLFRHSTATNLLRNKTPLEVISTLLRHQSVTTTAIYARVDVPMLLEVAQPWPTAGGVK